MPSSVAPVDRPGRPVNEGSGAASGPDGAVSRHGYFDLSFDGSPAGVRTCRSGHGRRTAARDRRPGPGRPLEPGLPAGRPHADHRARRQPAHRRRRRPALSAAGRPAARGRGRPVRAARRGRGPRVRAQRPDLLDLCRAGNRRSARQQHRSGACAARGRPARGREDDLQPEAQGRESRALRLAHRVRPPGDICGWVWATAIPSATRRRTRPTTSARSSASTATAGRPPTTPLCVATAPRPKSGAWATATSRVRPRTRPPVSCGSRSMGRRAATRSMSPRPAAITAGRS